jgi:hypothetical protein
LRRRLPWPEARASLAESVRITATLTLIVVGPTEVLQHLRPG